MVNPTKSVASSGQDTSPEDSLETSPETSPEASSGPNSETSPETNSEARSETSSLKELVAELPPEAQLRLANKIERHEKQWRTIVADERAKREVTDSQSKDRPDNLSSVTTEISHRKAYSETSHNCENPKEPIRKKLRLDSCWLK